MGLPGPIQRRWLDAQQGGLRRLRACADRLRPAARGPAHLRTGLIGEQEALFALARQGYTVVARRWTSAKMRGDIDLVAWDQDWLCFVEVKTRTARDNSPAESSVDEHKRRMIRSLARAYTASFPKEQRRLLPVRFDIVSVYLPGGPRDDQTGNRTGGHVETEILRGAFHWH